MNRALYDLPAREADETQASLIELLEVRELIGKPTRQLSLGERMKCELVAALLHRPRVLFLDEPTIGLDVSMQARIRQFVREYNDRFQATVLLTSHYMDDVVALCPRVIVIDKGRLIYDGDLKELVRRIRPDKRITIRLSQPAEPERLARLGQIVSQTDNQVVLTVPGPRVSEVLRDALAALAVADLAVEDPPLEEVMRELFNKGVAARADGSAPVALSEPAP
jgi:ABC-2 type transport system ATP-binding protein